MGPRLKPLLLHPPLMSGRSRTSLSSATFAHPVRHIGSKAVTQKAENFRIADFEAEDASASVCFRPIADYHQLDGPSSKVVTPSGITSHVAFDPTKICWPISISGSPLTHPSVMPCTFPSTMPHNVEPHLLQNLRPAPCFPM